MDDINDLYYNGYVKMRFQIVRLASTRIHTHTYHRPQRNKSRDPARPGCLNLPSAPRSRRRCEVGSSRGCAEFRDTHLILPDYRDSL